MFSTAQHTFLVCTLRVTIYCKQHLSRPFLQPLCVRNIFPPPFCIYLLPFTVGWRKEQDQITPKSKQKPTDFQFKNCKSLIYGPYTWDFERPFLGATLYDHVKFSFQKPCWLALKETI